jgi:hypothetical protein
MVSSARYPDRDVAADEEGAPRHLQCHPSQRADLPSAIRHRLCVILLGKIQRTYRQRIYPLLLGTLLARITYTEGFMMSRIYGARTREFGPLTDCLPGAIRWRYQDYAQILEMELALLVAIAPPEPANPCAGPAAVCRGRQRTVCR